MEDKQFLKENRERETGFKSTLQRKHYNRVFRAIRIIYDMQYSSVI